MTQKNQIKRYELFPLLRFLNLQFSSRVKSWVLKENPVRPLENHTIVAFFNWNWNNVHLLFQYGKYQKAKQNTTNQPTNKLTKIAKQNDKKNNKLTNKNELQKKKKKSNKIPRKFYYSWQYWHGKSSFWKCKLGKYYNSGILWKLKVCWCYPMQNKMLHYLPQFLNAHSIGVPLYLYLYWRSAKFYVVNNLKMRTLPRIQVRRS